MISGLLEKTSCNCFGTHQTDKKLCYALGIKFELILEPHPEDLEDSFWII